MPTIRSESAWTETLQQIGQPSKQSIAGDGYALYPSSLNSVTSVTTSRPGAAAWKSCVPSPRRGTLAWRPASSPRWLRYLALLRICAALRATRPSSRMIRRTTFSDATTGVSASPVASARHETGSPVDPRLNPEERAFSVGGRNRLWVGDITYIPTREGWLYLAAVIDAFSRKVVGWSMSERITEKVAIDAIEQAVGREGPPDDGSLVFHDDQGAQHASRSFQRCLDSPGVIRSVSRPGTPLDNAVAESFFKTLKRELAEGRSYGTRDEAKQDIFKYIELYYNRVRMHSTLGYMSPVEYERQYA